MDASDPTRNSYYNTHPHPSPYFHTTTTHPSPQVALMPRKGMVCHTIHTSRTQAGRAGGWGDTGCAHPKEE